MIQFVLIFGTLVSAASLQYEVGKTYEYTYETDLSLNNQPLTGTKVNRDIGLRLAANVELSFLWKNQEEMLVRAQFSDATVSRLTREDLAANFKVISKEPFYFVWRNDGMVGELFTSDGEDSTSLNLKKGFVSLLQFKTENGQWQEVDASGDCTASYIIDGTTVTKRKTGCSNLDISGQFKNINNLLDVTNERIVETIYEMRDGIIQASMALESLQVSLNAKSSAGLWLQMRQHLQLNKVSVGKTLSGASPLAIVNGLNDGKTYLGMLPVTDTDSVPADSNKQLKDLVASAMKNLESDALSTTASAKAFLSLLSRFREADKNEIVELLKSDDSFNVLPQLIDLAVAAQTDAAQEALMEVVQFDDSYQTDLAERYLLAVAYSSHPSVQLLEDLFNLYKKKIDVETTQASLSLALGAVLRTYQEQQKQQSNLFSEDSNIVEEIQNAFTHTLDSCETPACKVVALRSLANARLPGTLSTLMKHAEGADVYSVSAAALKAIKNLGQQYLTTEVQAMLRRIYHQNRQSYDSTVRTAALEMLLTTQVSTEDLVQILLSVGDQEQFEMSKYVLETINNAAKWDENLRQTLKKASSSPRVSNYDLLAPKGKSSALSGFMADTADGKGTFSLTMENSNVGIMKRSMMDVQLMGRNQSMSFVSFGLFARGLEAVAGDSADDGDQDAEEITAGLALDLMDVSLRPVTFFEGQGGLMSAVWSAPSSPTSVLQGNLLLHDHIERLHLQNGLVAELEVQGCVSFDLSGSISISLWSRNSHSVVTNSGALAISSVLKVNSPLFNSAIMYDIEARSKIDFTTDVDFYEMPFKMCLQMEQPPFQYSESVSKTESAKGFKHRYRSQQSRKQTYDGKSFSLNHRNAQQCKVLIPDD